MKNWFTMALLLSGVAPCSARAETNSTTFTAARARPAPLASPEIGPARMVTFRLQAAKAAQVLLKGQWPKGVVPMNKDSNGVWSVTVGPVDPGIWEYSFEVDGLVMIDPANSEVKPMRLPTVSILEVKGGQPLPWDLQDIPHGTVHWHSYFSKSLGRSRGLSVYTPPGYEGAPSAAYPVLYLQHGYGDNETTWIVHGKANRILDYLIDQGRAKPMIVVMMDGHALVPVTGNDSGTLQLNAKMFELDLLEDVVPIVEKEYRVKAGSTNRAIVGLSMGGGQSLSTGLNHPDQFAWVGGFSAATPTNTVINAALRDPAFINQKLQLLWIADGKEDFLLSRNEEFIGVLKEHKIRCEWHLTEGGHTWPVWRKNLVDFVPRLFR